MVTIRGLFRTQISKLSFFLKDLTLLAKSSISDIWEVLKPFDPSCPPPPPEKWNKGLYILYILNKITVTTENRSTVLHNLFLLDMSIFDDFITKNDPVKNKLLYGGGSTTSWPSLGIRRQNFEKFSVDSKSNILANFNLVLSTSLKISSDSKLGKGCSKIWSIQS